MDKYQKPLTKYVEIWQSLDNGETYRAQCYKNDQISFNQYEDIFRNKFFVIAFGKAIDKFYICKNQKFIELENIPNERFKLGNTKQFPFEIDFEDRIESVKVVFKNDFADDLIIPVNYIEGDKEKFYREKAMEERKQLLLKASVRHSTGTDLVNIYFQPCSNYYDHTEIQLFYQNQLMAKYKVEKELFFKAITGLAYGEYEYIVQQYNSQDEVIVQTDKVKFKLYCPNHGSKPIVYR